MKRVLIVDDNEQNRYYLSALLGTQGCEVDTAQDGAEALARAREARPDLIISDLLMPVMDGYTLLREWKSAPELQAIPFVVYTATYTGVDDEKLALKMGADAFIVKPCEPDELWSRLQRVELDPVHPGASQSGQEPGLLLEHNATLARKLEQKMRQLEESHVQLQADVAAREVAREALRVSEANFRLLAEALPQLVWITLPDGWHLYFNQRWVDYTGLSRAESEGHGWSGPIHPEDRPRVEAAWTLATGTGSEYSVEARLRKADGSYRWWLVRGLPARDDRGRIEKWFGTCTDIHELKEAAARLQQTEAQLRQAQKMEAVGRLAGGIAHDFNNLLSVILSYTGMAVDELPPDDPLRTDLGEVIRAGERAAGLTRQLLAFSRQQVLAPQVVDLGAIVEGMKKLLERLLGEDVELVLERGESLVPIHADPGQLEQIILNLAVNARDAMPHGGRLSIETVNVQLDAEDPEVEPGQYVLLAVSDTGSGMGPAVLEKIFEPFFTTKEPGQGTGLGLATVFGIVKQSQGHIRVFSEPGAGTTFKVYLPGTQRAREPAPTSAPTSRQLHGSETILLVEDDAQVRGVNRVILRRNGYTVLEAPNGVAALELGEAYAERIDLLLTDLVMPRMGGYELAERLLALRPELKVLYVSGYSESAAAPRFGREPGVAFAQKPLTPDVLLRKVREVLSPTP